MNKLLRHIFILFAMGFDLSNYPKNKFPVKQYLLFKQHLWRRLLKNIGEESHLRANVKVSHPENISLGKGCKIGPNSILKAPEEIIIGDYFLAGPGLIIYTSEHGLENNGVPFTHQKNVYAKVIIGNNVYVGARVTILKGVTIGDNVVIAAGSVVAKDIPSGEIWGGVPAKRVKSIS